MKRSTRMEKDDRKMKGSVKGAGAKISNRRIQNLPWHLVRVMLWAWLVPQAFTYTEPEVSLELTSDTIINYLNRLSQLGFLIKKKGKSQPDLYKINERKSTFRLSTKARTDDVFEGLSLVPDRVYNFKTLAETGKNSEGESEPAVATSPRKSHARLMVSNLVNARQASIRDDIKILEDLLKDKRVALRREKRDGKQFLEWFGRALKRQRKNNR